jgi:hypothetical protein
LDGHAKEVWALKQGEHDLGFLQADLELAGLSGHPLDGLVHGVHDRPCEVRLGVGQSLRVVRAGGLGQGKESLALKVRQQDSLLPRRPGLDEELGQHPGQRRVLSR